MEKWDSKGKKVTTKYRIEDDRRIPSGFYSPKISWWYKLPAQEKSIFFPPNEPAFAPVLNRIDPEEAKEPMEIAKQVVSSLTRILSKTGTSLYGKKILDVNFGLGFNAQAMASKNAKVYGVEPNAQKSSAAMFAHHLESNNVFQGKLQDMPAHPKCKFDIATVFSWDMPDTEQREFIQALSRSIKPKGQVIIHIKDNDLHQSATIQPLAEALFSKIEVAADQDTNCQFLILSSPKRAATLALKASVAIGL